MKRWNITILELGKIYLTIYKVETIMQTSCSIVHNIIKTFLAVYQGETKPIHCV